MYKTYTICGFLDTNKIRCRHTLKFEVNKKSREFYLLMEFPQKVDLFSRILHQSVATSELWTRAIIVAMQKFVDSQFFISSFVLLLFAFHD